jgi:hypothetical protein
MDVAVWPQLRALFHCSRISAQRLLASRCVAVGTVPRPLEGQTDCPVVRVAAISLGHSTHARG